MDTVIEWFKEWLCIEKCRISIYSEVSTFADFVHSTLTIERFTTMISKEVDLNHTHRVYRSFNAYRVTELMQMWMSHWCYGDNAMTTKDRLLTSLCSVYSQWLVPEAIVSGWLREDSSMARQTCCRIVDEVEAASADMNTMITEYIWAWYEGHLRATVSMPE